MASSGRLDSELKSRMIVATLQVSVAHTFERNLNSAVGSNYGSVSEALDTTGFVWSDW
jgi:hypothetical protein